MTDLTDLLRADAVLTSVSVAGKKPLFTALATALARQTGGEAKAIADALVEREKLGSTGFGGGVDQLEGVVEVAVVVDADLADDIDGVAGSGGLRTERAQTGVGAHGDVVP